MAELESLVREKRIVKSKLTRLSNKIDASISLESENVSKVYELYIEQLDKLYSEASDLFKQILVICEEEDFEKFEIEFVEVLDKLDNLKLALKVKVINVDASQSQSSVSGDSQRSSVNLPKITLPVFSGDLHTWISFRDLFTATIRINESLSEAQKLQYLKLSVRGEAFSLINSFQISDANFEKAWNALSNRYHNEVELIYCHLDRFFCQPVLSQDCPRGLRKLLDTSMECIENLKILKQPVDKWDSILVYLLRKKLDQNSLREWELSNLNKEIPLFENFRMFLETRARALESACLLAKGQTARASKTPKLVKTQSLLEISDACAFCGDSHSIYQCKKFVEKPIAERKQFVVKNKLCFNCLRKGHFLLTCKGKCCKLCGKKHHSLLHSEFSVKVSNSENGQESESSVSHCASNSKLNFKVLLPTAIIKVCDSLGNFVKCKALIDSGSESSFIREDCVQRLSLTKKRVDIRLSGLLAKYLGNSKGAVDLKITSHFPSNFLLETSALIIPRITCKLPRVKISVEELMLFSHLKLADCHVGTQSQVDVLLGAEVFSEIYGVNTHTNEHSSLKAHETKVGWVLCGKMRNAPPKLTTTVLCNIAENLQRFWDLEHIPELRLMSELEQKCEIFYKATTTRDKDGRYIVKLPFTESSEQLGDSRYLAIKRLKTIERKFKNDVDLENSYKTFMNEYKLLGHMEPICDTVVPIASQDCFYLPHHAVRKDSSKFRIVFDGSAKTSTGVSLNDKLMVGPVVQQTIIQILIRFRSHQIAMMADIVKMYRQFKVDSQHSEFQRIVWRESPNQPIQDFKLVTVTYGTASAPFLATRSLYQLAIDEARKFPQASEIVKRDFYVDDLMTGSECQESALKLKDEIIELLKCGCLELKKWASNSQMVIESIPETNRNTSLPLSIDADDSIKALGLQWHPTSDTFSFKVQHGNITELTKRTLLSEISKVFDPLGLLSPVTIKSKMIMQELWKLKISWDDQLPLSIQNEWKKLVKDMKNLHSLRIPRCIAIKEACYFELHGYCDASEKAYAAALYLMSSNNEGKVLTKLVLAKTRVAPLKTISVPRLELCGALLLAKTVKLFISSTSIPIAITYCWTDSTIVLSWLTQDPSRWKTFVANRVTKIQSSVPQAEWRHISSDCNPADYASRGIFPTDFLNLNLWWSGPATEQSYQQSESQIDPKALVEEKTKTISHNVYDAEESWTSKLLRKYSSLTKLKRILAYIRRFIYNVKNPSQKIKHKFLSSEELTESFKLLIRNVQKEEFAKEICLLKKKIPLSCKSQIASLNPFIDEEELLRVGGRLRHSKVPEGQRHPILLPKKSVLTELIAADIHISYLHAGPQLMLSILIRNFWILSARDVLRRIVHKCVVCCRHKAQTIAQFMGDLPRDRVNQCKPFLKCGVDYTGPFSLRMSKGRGRATYKGYVAVFVCFVTKAIHLELVGDLTSEGFIAALKRFISRRGKCSDIYSDCGTNFIGASKKLKQNGNFPNNSDKMFGYLAKESIKWHFNPPAAPHMGGLWEAGVKSVKYHLKRIVGQTTLSYEELNTTLVQIEACLNSRPLCSISSDPNDLTPLTPGHFLTGDFLYSVPECDFTKLPDSKLSRWQLVQKLMQHFWYRWKSEYLSRLQNRPKWLKKRKNLKLGDLVLLKSDQLPPSKWKLGRVTELFPGPDDVVRVVTIKTSEGHLKRPIVKLCLLPFDNCE